MEARNQILKLTKRRLDKLPILARGRYEVSDSKLSGFKAVVSSRNLRTGATKITFIVRYRVGSTRRTYKIGTYDPLTPEQAREIAKRILLQVSEGRDPQEERHTKRQIPSFDRLVKEYLTQLSKRDIRNDRAKLENVLSSRWGSRQITAISAADIKAFLKSRLEAGNSPATHNRYRALILAFFNFAIDQGYLNVNPAKETKPLPENNKRRRYLTKDEIARLFAALAKVGTKNTSNVIQLLLFTGQRLSEILRSEWQHVDFNERTLNIPQTKNGRAHLVHLPREAIAVLQFQKSWLEQQGRTSDFVFPARHGNGHLTSVSKTWYAALEVAQLKDVRLHDLRHTYASWAIQKGASLYTVQALLNHSSSQVTERYAHLADAQLKEAAAQATGGMVVNLDEFKVKKSA